MKLTVRNGKLKLWSIYKLIVIGWTASIVVVFGVVLSLILGHAVLVDEFPVNGEVIRGRLNIVIAALPIIFLFPIAAFFQSIIVAAYLTFGIWLYSKFQPINVKVDG